MTKRRNIFGVSWKKLKDSPTTPCGKQEPVSADSPTKRSGSTSNVDRVMTRMMTFRDSIDTLKQKMKLTSRSNPKRLTNSTPSPFSSVRKHSTPGSSVKRLSRREVKMYSPFEIITPSCTPVKSIKMGTLGCKRLGTSNANLEKELTSIVDGMQTLVQTKSFSSPAWQDGRSRRTGIRTTPKGGRSGSKKPLFL